MATFTAGDAAAGRTAEITAPVVVLVVAGNVGEERELLVLDEVVMVWRREVWRLAT